MKTTITKPYLWFPVQKGAPKCTVEVFSDKRKIYEFDIEASLGGSADFHSHWHVAEWVGEELEFQSNCPDGWWEFVSQQDGWEEIGEHRPSLHFTAHTGWLNDPNGLHFDGVNYHLYFQHNPYGVTWGNMHWGHAVSKDLIHWEQLDEAMYPDEHGVMFSGSACIHPKTGSNDVLMFYTAWGGEQRWSKNAQTSQCFARTLGSEIVKERMCFWGPNKESRDPKVFFHESTAAFVMVLYLHENDFGIFRSNDLHRWTQTQTITLAGATECPDLFLLKNKEGQSRWVLLTADGFYYIGEFDGYCFTNYSHRHHAYMGNLPYAAQTWSNVMGERTVLIAWLRTLNTGHRYRGLMSLPMDVSLNRNADALQLHPAKEFEKNRKREVRYSGEPVKMSIKHGMYEFVLKLDEDESCKMLIGENEWVFNPKQKVLIALNERYDCLSTQFRIFVDCDIVEIFALDEGLYCAAEIKQDPYMLDIRFLGIPRKDGAIKLFIHE